MTRRSAASLLTTTALVLAAAWARATVVGGGGARARDCVAVFDAAVNSPAPPQKPRHVDCVDGMACDQDGARNGRCQFTVRLCVNATTLPDCTPGDADALTVDHALDNGDPRFDTEFQALQNRANLLGFPDNTTADECTLASLITVRLQPPSGTGPWQKGVKKLRVTTFGRASGRITTDGDRMLFTCRPEGNGLYTPLELYNGTFDRIAVEVFARRCAVSGCHDSQGHKANQILLPNAAYSQIVGVTPYTAAAAAAGLERVTPGDPSTSLLYRKITNDLLPGWGGSMPRTGPALTPAQIDLIRLWILGDGVTGPAPAGGWVQGTDQ